MDECSYPLRRPLLVAALALAASGVIAASASERPEARLSVGTSGAVPTPAPTATTAVPALPVPTAEPSTPTSASTPRRSSPSRASTTTSTTARGILAPILDVITPTTREPNVLKGRVADELGLPVAGMCIQSTLPEMNRPQILGRSGADGRYRIEGEFAFALLFPCDDNAGTPFGYEAPMEMIRGDSVDWQVGGLQDFTVKALGAVRGTLVDEQGHPVSGVLVSIGGFGLDGPPPPTGADGRFEARNVRRGTIWPWLYQEPYFGGAPQRASQIEVLPGVWNEVVLVVHPWAY